MKKKALLTLTCAMVLAMSCAAAADIALTENGSAPEGADLISGTSIVKVQGDNGYYLSDLEGNALTADTFANGIYEEEGFITAYSYAAEDELNSECLLNQSGEEILPAEYGDIKVFSSKWAAGYKLVEASAGNYDYQALLGDGYYLIDQVDIYYLSENNAALLKSFSRDEYQDADAHGEYITVADRSSGKVTLYDASWNVAAEDVGYTWDTGDINTTWYTIFSDNGQQGVMDNEGNVVMEPAFKYVYDYTGKYAEVSTGDKYGLIDMDGNVVVPAEYDEIGRNYDAPVTELYGESATYEAAGYFAVEKDGKGGFVATGGEVTCEPAIASDVLDLAGASASYTDLTGKIHILAADGTDSVLPDEVSEIRAIQFTNGFLYKTINDDYDYGVVDWHGNELLPMENSDVEATGDGTTLMVNVDYDHAICYTINY